MADSITVDLEAYSLPWALSTMTNGFHPGEMFIISAARQTGKSTYYQYAKQWNDIFMNQPVQILWKKLPGRKLKAYTDGDSLRGLRDADMDEVQKWLWTNIPSAKRLSFDMWLFEQDKHITMFLMKWTS